MAVVVICECMLHHIWDVKGVCVCLPSCGGGDDWENNSQHNSDDAFA